MLPSVKNLNKGRWHYRAVRSQKRRQSSGNEAGARAESVQAMKYIQGGAITGNGILITTLIEFNNHFFDSFITYKNYIYLSQLFTYIEKKKKNQWYN